MKLKLKYGLIFVLTISFLNSYAQDCSQKSAADFYANQMYAEAMNCYAELLKTGESPELYYNYANACYKLGNMGLAILNYERALKINPFYEDAKFNLQLANQQIADKIEPLEQFFLTSWVKNLGKLLSSNQWASLTILLFLLFLVSTLAFLFGSWRWIRKTAFFVGILFLVCSIVSFSFAFATKYQQTQTPDAIVMEGSIVVRSAPDESGTELMVLHEGTKVAIKTQLGEWFEIVLADGNSGWTRKSVIEKI